MRLYKYVTVNTAKIVLETGKLRWSSPFMFNDPFDVQFDLHVNSMTRPSSHLSLGNCRNSIVEGRHFNLIMPLAGSFDFFFSTYRG